MQRIEKTNYRKLRAKIGLDEQESMSCSFFMSKTDLLLLFSIYYIISIVLIIYEHE